MLTHLLVPHVQVANKHFRDTGLAADCDAEEFMAAADSEFSPDFKERIGKLAFSEAVTYDAWMEDLGRFLVVIDRDETEPYDPAATYSP